MERELARALERAEAADRTARVLYAGASDPMLEIDGAGVVRGANASAVSRFGASIVGKDLSELFRPGDSETVERMFAGAMESSLDRDLQLLDGHSVCFRGVVPGASGRAVVVLNLTPGAPAGGRTTELQRRAAVGGMASLLAHELNNPLTVLQLRTDLLVEDAPSVATKEQLDLLIQALGRMTRAVRTFQRVARGPKPSDEPVLLAEIVDRALAECGAATRVQLEPVPPGFVVRGDEDALSLALEVLLRSATESGPARVRVEGFNHTVRVEVVAEAGPSSAAVARRASRPIDDRSQVLAHAIASLVARDHGGEVRTSERDGATVLHLELPRAVEGAEVHGRQPARLLVVDDEPLVAAVLADWCVRNGHACRIAGSAEEAMAALTESAAFDAVLIDERLPGASGVELLGFLEREFPALLGRAALMSGSTPAPSTRYAFLPKPFTRRQLADLIETLLAR